MVLQQRCNQTLNVGDIAGGSIWSVRATWRGYQEPETTSSNDTQGMLSAPQGCMLLTMDVVMLLNRLVQND